MLLTTPLAYLMLKNRQRIVRQVGRERNVGREGVQENKVRNAAHRPNYCAQKSQQRLVRGAARSQHPDYPDLPV